MRSIKSILPTFSILLLLFSLAAAAAPQTSGENSGFGVLRDSAWSADGTRFLIITSSGAQVYTWDEEQLTLLSSFTSSRHPRCGVLNADGSQVFLGTEEGNIEQWDVDTGALTKDWDAHRLPILDLAISRDGTLLLSAGWHSDAIVWDTASHTKQSTLETSAIGAAVGSFAPDGSAVLWSKEFNIQVFDPRNGDLTANRATQSFSQSPTFSPDGSRLAGVYAGQAQVIETSSGRLLQVLDAEFTIQSIAISPDNTSAALLGDAGQYLLYDLTGGFLLERWGESKDTITHDIIFSPQSTHLFLLGGAVHCRDLHTLGIFSQFHIAGRADDYTVSPDGQTLASRVDTLNYVEIWQNGMARPIQTIENFPVPVMDAQFLPDGQLLVSADSLTFWDAASAELRDEWQIPLPESATEFVVWVYDPDNQQSSQVKLDHLPGGRIGISHDGRLIAVEGMDGSLYVWDIVSSQPQPTVFALGVVNTSKNMVSQVKEIVFSTDNIQVVVWLNDDTFRVFDLATRTQTAAFPLPPGAPGFDETCLRRWDVGRQILLLADTAHSYEINPTDDSVIQHTGGICGFNGADYLIENDQILLSNGILSIAANDKGTTPRLFVPDNDLLVYQNGRFSDFRLFLRHADSSSRQQDLFTALTPDRYLGYQVKASHFDFETGTVSLVDAKGNRYRDGVLQAAVAFSPATAAFSDDGMQLLLSGFDGSVSLQAESGLTALIARKNRPDIFRALAFDRTGSRKAAGNDAGTVTLWDENNAAFTFNTPGGAVQALLFSPDGDYLAVRGSNFISVWQLSPGGNEPILLENTPRGIAMAFSPDGDYFLTSTRDGFETPLIVWDFPALEPRSHYNIPAQQIIFTSNDRFFAGSEQLWDCTLGEICRTIQVPETFTTGNLFIAVDNTKAVLITSDGRVVEVTLSE